MGGLSIALIPFYLKRLGADQWGIVATCMAIQGFLGILDAGLGQIMPRDVARVGEHPSGRARVFKVFASAYLFLALAGLVLGQLFANWLATSWFGRGQSIGPAGELALRLVFLQFFFQFSNNAHLGYWNGIQAQALANFRQCLFGTLKHAGALLSVYAWKADAVAYVLPFFLVSAAEYFFNRRSVGRSLAGVSGGRVSRSDFSLLAREAGTLALGVVIGMLVSQMDRIVLSRLVETADFGRYVIVANLGLALMQLQHPLLRAFFPRIASESGGKEGSRSFWMLALAVLVLCVLPCLCIVALAPWLLRTWTGDAQLVADGAAPFRMIVCAVVMNALYHLIYQRILLSGRGHVIVLINLAGLLAVTALLVWLAPRYGIATGGLAWLLGSFLQLCFGVAWGLKSNAIGSWK